MGEMTDHRPENVDYPLNMIVAVIAPEQVSTLIAALTANGFEHSQIDVGEGSDDGQRIEDTTERSLSGRLTSALNADDVAQRKAYVEALREGEAVIRVHLKDESQKSVVGQTIADNGGRFIHYYGRWTVETMMP